MKPPLLVPTLSWPLIQDEHGRRGPKDHLVLAPVAKITPYSALPLACIPLVTNSSLLPLVGNSGIDTPSAHILLPPELLLPVIPWKGWYSRG